MSNPLILSVVGHTNVGKTSFLRTLMRNAAFGEVSNQASTTRHVEGASLKVDGEEVLRLFDTPGLEDAMSLLDYLEQLKPSGQRIDRPTLLSRFLEGSEARHQFEQEAKVLRQLLASDAGLYVIDAREPVLPKYLDELEVLGMCGKPLFPVLNFVAQPGSRADEWREGLARSGLHALLTFDSVTPPLDGEMRLYESLAVVLEQRRPQLERLIQDRKAQAATRRQGGTRLIADMLIDVAAFRVSVAPDAAVVKNALESMRQSVREREQACVTALLRLYSFRAEDAKTNALPLSEGRWEDDIFHPDTLRRLGVQVGGGAAAGAAAGLAVDFMVGGVTLGTGALLGSLVGGTAQTGHELGARVLGKLRGVRVLSVEDPVISLLALRQQRLLRSLEVRGHAAQQPVSIESPQDDAWRKGKLPQPLVKARAHPDWSSLNTGAQLDAPQRQLQVVQLAEALVDETSDQQGEQ